MIIPCTPDDVRSINGSTLDDAAIQPFIDTAEILLNAVEPCMTGKSITEEAKTSACAYLACHLMSLSGVAQNAGESGIKTKERFENYSVEFAIGQYSASGVLSTPYGNTANMLSGGCLQESEKRSAGVFFAGGA